MTYGNKTRWLSLRTAALALLPLGLALSGPLHHAQAQTLAPAVSCEAALASLMAAWNAVGYTEPSKPSQMIVYGRNGHTTTAGRFHYLQQEIRASAQECEANRQQEAMRHIDTVRLALNIGGPAAKFGD